MSKDLLAYKTIDPLGLINKNPTKKDPLPIFPHFVKPLNEGQAGCRLAGGWPLQKHLPPNVLFGS